MTKLFEQGFLVGNIFDKVDIDQFNFYADKVEELFNLYPFEFRFATNGHNERDRCNVDESQQVINEVNASKYKFTVRFKELGTKYNEDCRIYFQNLTNQIVYENYGDIVSLNSVGNFTLYENDDFAALHQDGQDSNRICAILIYLTKLENYYNGGGNFIIADPSNKFYANVTPIRGNYVILDFTKNNVFHEVEPVKNNFKRYSWLTFVNRTN